MEILIILVVIAFLVGERDNKGIWKAIPHRSRNGKTWDHTGDWQIWG